MHPASFQYFDALRMFPRQIWALKRLYALRLIDYVGWTVSLQRERLAALYIITLSI